MPSELVGLLSKCVVQEAGEDRGRPAPKGRHEPGFDVIRPAWRREIAADLQTLF